HLVLRALSRPGRDQGIDLGLVAPAGVARLVAHVTDEVGAADRAQQRVPQLLLDEDEHVVVGPARVTAVRRARHAGAELVARPLHRLSEALVIAQADPDQVDDGVLHRDLDLLALAGGLTLHQRGEDSDHAVHAGARVADGRPHVRRWPVGNARDAHRPAHGLGDRLLALVLVIGPLPSQTLDAPRHA